MPCEERVKISMPSSFSNSLTDELRAGWETYRAWEASFIEPHSTILTMYFSCSSVIKSIYIARDGRHTGL